MAKPYLNEPLTIWEAILAACVGAVFAFLLLSALVNLPRFEYREGARAATQQESKQMKKLGRDAIEASIIDKMVERERRGER